MKKIVLFLLPFFAQLQAVCFEPGLEYCCEDSLLCPYITAGAGAVFPSKSGNNKVNSTPVVFTPTELGISQFSLPNVLWNNSYEIGYEVFGAFGCSLKNNVRVEEEFIYQNFQRKIAGTYSFLEVEVNTMPPPVFSNVNIAQSGVPLHRAFSTVNIYAALSNLYFDYQYCRWTATIGGGFGAAWIHSKGKESAGTLHVKTTVPPIVDETSPTLEDTPALVGSAYAWQLKLGLSYDVSRCFVLGVNYRLLGTGRFHTATGNIVSNPNTSVQAIFHVPQHEINGLLNNSIDISLKYLF